MENVGPNNPTKSSKGYAIVEGGSVPVQAVTIDETVRELGLDRVDFINMDIEGGERHAIAGARETIQRFGPRMVVCIHHLPDDRQAILPLLREIEPPLDLKETALHASVFGRKSSD